MAAAFGLAFAILLRAGGDALDAADAPRGRTVLEYVEGVHRSLLLLERRTRGAQDVVIAGDSHLARVGRQPPVHVWFERALWTERPEDSIPTIRRTSPTTL